MSSSPESLAEAVKSLAKEEGADLVGIASASRYEGAPAKVKPQAHMPEAKSVIVMAVHHPDASINFGAEPNSNFSGGFQIGMIPKLDTMALRVARFVESQGYAAVPLSCTYYWRHRKVEGVPFDHAASFSHMSAFVAAGLGEYGWHGMVMSPKYGPRQRIISVITDAPLKSDPLYGGEPLCDRCKQCEKACWGKNYGKGKLLSPETISFSIEGKKFEYANVNRWRCFWGEQCHLDMGKLAERESLNESEIYEALDGGVKRAGIGGAGYMCSSLKFCMSKQVRRWDKSKARNPLRAKPAPSGDAKSLKEEIIEKARRAGADRVAILPLASFDCVRKNLYEGFRADEMFKTFKWVLAIARSTPRSLGGESPLAAKNKRPLELLTRGRMMIGTLDIARALDDKGHEAMQAWTWGGSGFNEQAAKLAGWEEGQGDEGRIIIESMLCDAPLERAVERIPSPLEKLGAIKELLDLKSPGLERIDMLGVAKLSSLDPEASAELRKLMPEARSLIVVGAKLLKRVVELAGRQEADCAVSYQYVNYQSLREAFWTAQDIASSLAAKGIQAAPLFEAEVPSRGQPTPYVGTLPDLRAQAPFAAAAGLGFIGKSGFLVSPEFGPRQRFAFVLSSAELPESAPIKGACPQACEECAKACPMKALDASAKADVFPRNESRCEWARVLGMSEGEGSKSAGWELPELPVPESLDDDARKKALARKDPIQVRCYGNPNNGDTQVERCLQACPLGKG